MFNRKTRIAMVAGVAAIALLAGIWEGQAVGQCCGSSPAVVTYARPYAAGRISWTSAYGVGSSCNPWVPGSCGYSVYRPVAAYSPIRTTAYMPIAMTAYSPIATTAYSPCAAGANCVTTLQTRQVPGQPIRNLLRVLLPPYRPIPVTTCYTPSTSYYPSACSSCYSAPSACSSCYSASYFPTGCSSCGPAACSSCCTSGCDSCSSCGSSGSSCISGACGSGNVTPSYYNGTSPSSSESGTPSTYKQESQSNTELRLMPTPDANTEPATYSKPTEVDRDARTAMQPIRQAVLYRPVSLTRSAAPATAAVDFGGWRASSD